MQVVLRRFLRTFIFFFRFCTAANNIYRKAENHLKSGDDENSYILFMRYLFIIQTIQKSYEFHKSKVFMFFTCFSLKLVSAIFYQIHQTIAFQKLCFLFHLKSSFRSRDIQFFLFPSSLSFLPVSHCFRG